VIDNYSKNILATYLGCIECGLDVVAVLDDHPAFAGLDYRGVEIMPFDRARVLVEGEARACGIVLSNVNPAQMKFRLAELRELLAVPVLGLWEPREGRRVGGGDAQRQ